jgi:hypothetical protein
LAGSGGDCAVAAGSHYQTRAGIGFQKRTPAREPLFKTLSVWLGNMALTPDSAAKIDLNVFYRFGTGSGPRTATDGAGACNCCICSGRLALILACLGISGVVSRLVPQRTREIGVRLAVGAAPSDVIAMVGKQTLKPVA